MTRTVPAGPALQPDGAAPAHVHGPVHDLGDQWRPGPDGLPYRRAGRVLIVDPDDRLLLLRGHDADQPERSWWFTVGGGADPGESPREAAAREVFEETGIRLSPVDLVGPVLTRSAVFDFCYQRRRQDEEFFWARVERGAALSRSGWTALENDLVDELRWFGLDELAQVRLEVFPADLVALVRSLLGGWDGRTRHVDETGPQAG